MDQVRIVINSCPRSAHAWLQTLLIKSVGRKNEISHDDVDSQFIIRSNTPVMMFANFENIIQTTILRSPDTIIPSIVTKTMGGLGGTTTAGITMPHEYGNNIDLNGLITHQFSVYKRWIDGLTANINTLMPFTFEQITTDVEFCIRSILDNFNIEYYLYSNDEIPELLQTVAKQIRVHDKGNIGYNNPVPVEEKPDIYYDAVEITKNHKFLKQSLDLYNNALELVFERQKSYG